MATALCLFICEFHHLSERVLIHRLGDDDSINLCDITKHSSYDISKIISYTFLVILDFIVIYCRDDNLHAIIVYNIHKNPCYNFYVVSPKVPLDLIPLEPPLALCGNLKPGFGLAFLCLIIYFQTKEKYHG